MRTSALRRRRFALLKFRPMRNPVGWLLVLVLLFGQSFAAQRHRRKRHVSDTPPPEMHSPGRPTRSPEVQNVTIASGDNLERIATRHLGTFNGTILRQIRVLNPGILNPDHIEPGRTLRLPTRVRAAGREAPGSK